MTLEITNLSVSHGAGMVLHPTSFRVLATQCAVIHGPSGSGKSSLLKAIAGLSDPGTYVQGRIGVDGRAVDPLPAEQRGIGMLFQRPILFSHLSVGQNVALGLAPMPKASRAARRAATAQWLARVGLENRVDDAPATLSGGEQARVALVRALAAAPRAMLLDEPFSALDPALRAEVRNLTYAHLAEAGLPVVLVSHDADDAPASALTPVWYAMRDGRLSPT